MIQRQFKFTLIKMQGLNYCIGTTCVLESALRVDMIVLNDDRSAVVQVLVPFPVPLKVITHR